MIKVEHSIVINRSIEEVFGVVSNHEKYSKWDPSVIEVQKTSAGPIGSGTTWRSVSRRLGRRRETESEIVEYAPNRTVTRQHTQGMPVKARFTCESIAGGTRVIMTIESELSGPFKLVAPVLGPVAERSLAASLANLKQLMEARAL